jgi:hypothetical protein
MSKKWACEIAHGSLDHFLRDESALAAPCRLRGACVLDRRDQVRCRILPGRDWKFPLRPCNSIRLTPHSFCGLVEFLAVERRGLAASRNALLAAIKSIMHCVENRNQSAIEQVRFVVAIPVRKSDQKPRSHLNVAETQVIPDAPDHRRR